MTPALLLHYDGNWLLLEGDECRNVPEYPEIDRATIVLTDFDGAISGVCAFNGKRKHAEAMVNRHLRDEGLVDDETKVLIHHGARTSIGCQVLYTAVQMPAWQRMWNWVEAQPEHVLIVPQTALMQRLLDYGEGVVFHAGKRLHFLARLKKQVCYFSVVAHMETEEGLRAACKTLAEWIGQNYLADRAASTAKFLWYSVGDKAAIREDLSLSQYFSGCSGVPTFRAEQEKRLGEGAPDLAWYARLMEKIAVNPPFSKTAYLAEKNLARIGGAIAVVAVAVLAWDGLLFIEAYRLNAEIRKARAETQEIARNEPGDAPVAAQDFSTTRDFIDLVAKAQAGVDPYAFLKDLRDLAGEEIRITRVAMAAEKPLVIEGWVAATRNRDARLAEFLVRLRQRGFSTEAIEATQTTQARPGHIFAYRLHRLATSKGKQT
jgi:hypothetical protein